jgi:hypothetical protein
MAFYAVNNGLSGGKKPSFIMRLIIYWKSAFYLILSELRIVICLPSILMAPFATNSERQRKRENF